MKKIFLFLFVITSALFSQEFTYNYLGAWDNYGLPDYLEPQRDSISEDFTDRINSILVPRHNLVERHPELFNQSVKNKITLQQDADVFLTFFKETAGFRNSFGFYYYNQNDISDDKAVEFNGDSQYGVIPNYDALNTGTMTIECWVKPNDHKYQILYRENFIDFYVDWDIIYFKLEDQRTATVRLYNKPLIYKGWNHIVVTVNLEGSKSRVKIYVNGQQEEEKLVNAYLSSSTEDYRVAAYTDNNWDLIGGMDELVLYNIVLSDEQISERYNNRAGSVDLPTGINADTDVIARFQFNGSGDTVDNNCTIGAGHDMTLFNQPEYIHGVFGRPPASPEDLFNQGITIAFPNVSKEHSGGKLVEGDKVKIGHFPAGTVIGWFLYANGFRVYSILDNYRTNKCLFSDDDFNQEDPPINRHNIMFIDAESGNMVVGFEDIIRPWGDKDFDDATFILSTSPSNAVDTTGMISYGEPPANPVADLSLASAVNNANPSNGDEIQYSITVSNAGPDAATGIKIHDEIPEGLIYLSNSPGIGSYDLATNIWSISSLNAGESATLILTAEVNLDSLSQSAFNIGSASDYNVFVLDDMYQPTADVEGKIAVGNNANFENFSIGYDIRNNTNNGAVLVSGYNLTYLSGDVYGGDVTYVHETNLPDSNVGIINGTIRQDTLVNFEEAEDYLLSLSNTLKEYSVNGTTEFTYTQLAMTGTNPFLNVFKVNADTLSMATEVVISVPNGSVVLVNIGGDNIDWHGGLVVSGTDISNVMYNFYDADNITIHQIDVTGTILAPKAHINFISGVQNGQMIAKSLEGTAQYNNVPFVGLVPSDSVLVNIAEVVASEQDDPDSHPGNGVSTEDDYCSVSISFAAENATNNTGVEWELYSESGNGELIWAMTKDSEGNLLTGNWGGNIYRSTDNGSTWNLLNPDMNVNYIWALAVDDNVIYAGTDSGLYVSPDNGSTWNFSYGANLEFRSIYVRNGQVYAASWGGGVFVSDNNGVTWTNLNDDIVGIPFTSVVVTSSNNIILGSFDSGIYKSTDNGASFYSVPIDYRFVWSLIVNSNGYLFAGTYGNGVYSSIDGGETWQKDFGVTARYIYNFAIDANNDLFASSWSSGVFVALSGGKTFGMKSSNWKPLGLQGRGVTSIINGDTPEILFASTQDGKIYRTTNALTGIEESEIIPFKFGLFQNFPNPFNPSTEIKFSLAQKCNVTLKVYSMLGEEVAQLIPGKVMDRGIHSVVFNSKKLSSGVYFYRLKAGNFISTKKMILLK